MLGADPVRLNTALTHLKTAAGDGGDPAHHGELQAAIMELITALLSLQTQQTASHQPSQFDQQPNGSDNNGGGAPRLAGQEARQHHPAVCRKRPPIRSSLICPVCFGR